MSDYFFSSRPSFPWSVYPVGLPALAIVAAFLVVFTIWTYLGHPAATKRRILIVLTLRLLALLVTLLTAVRPSVGVNENPKQPATLLIGIDVSESMTVRDEVGGQARIDAVRKMLDKCQPLFDDLRNDHSIEVVLYKFGPSDFNEATSRWEPTALADAKRSDYGTYLNRVYTRWQAEARIRGHLIFGDGIDNGETISAAAEAARYGRRGVPIFTFLTGQPNSTPDAKDIVVTAIECNPSPAFIKNDVLVTTRVNAHSFPGAKVTARVSYFHEGKEHARNEEFTLDREKNNELKMTIKAPDTKGEIKVRVEVGLEKDGKIEPLPGELSPLNNWSETYLTVNKEGVRVLVIDQLRTERIVLLRALAREKRFDVYEVVRQVNTKPSEAERDLLDLEKHAFDVVIIGNVPAAELEAAVPGFWRRLADLIQKKGIGVMCLGGEYAFQDVPASVLPVTAEPAPRKAGEPNKSLIVDQISGQGNAFDYPAVPTQSGLERVFRLPPSIDETKNKWDRVNGVIDGKDPNGKLILPRRLGGFNRLVIPDLALSNYSFFARTLDDPNKAHPNAKAGGPEKQIPLLVGSERDSGGKGRWLAFAAFDTYLWTAYGQPHLRIGQEMHEQFWRQCVLYLAKQDEDKSQVYARPKYRQLKVTSEQEIRVGVKKPDDTDDPNAPLTVRIVPLAPGQAEPKPEDEAKATQQTVLTDKDGRKVLFRAPAPGEYFVVVTTPSGKKDGAAELRGTAKFIAIPDVSDEMLQVNARPESMEQLSVPTGGKALRLEDLPGFLQDLKTEAPPDIGKKPRYYPDWNRNRSRGFLPLWLTVFAVLLGAEWGLRRLWGMV